MKKNNYIISVFSRFLLFFVWLLFATSVNAENLLLSPKNGVVLNSNMPQLCWKEVNCISYEIWVDGIKIDSVGRNTTIYQSFPLSFGKHNWYIVASLANKQQVSEKGEFRIDDVPLTELPNNTQLLRYNWIVNSSDVVGRKGDLLSTPSVDTAGWFVTSIPSTVLTALIRNGVYPNPYYGLNNMKIPDMNDKYNSKYNLLKFSHLKNKNPWKNPYWYRTTFKVPESYAGKNVWLTFNEINYKAEIWLNGAKIADTIEVEGMERKFRFNISKQALIGKNNVLAIAIYPPSHSGEPSQEPLDAFSDPGQNMGDGQISRDYTKWDALGWDWQPSVRDRDMGITEDVYISATDEIEIDNLYATSNLNLPDTSNADVCISFDVINSSESNKEGNLNVLLSFGNDTIIVEQPFSIGAKQKLEIFLDKNNQNKLQIKNPRLWWPLGYGNPNLYSLSVQLICKSGEKAETNCNFGIRKVESYIGESSRVYKINGKNIYLKGGNWVMDMMLNWTSSRYEQEILLTKNANLNIIRVWGPTGIAPSSFYNAADKNGILIWQDFLNDYWGTFKNTPGFQPEINLYEKASVNIVKKLRNHPSLIIWCGGNEGVNPRESLLREKVLAIYDNRDSRQFLKASDGDGLHGGGPYHTESPEVYFKHPKLSGFSSEIGPSGVPVYESMLKFMPLQGLEWKSGYFPMNSEWAFHDANDWPGYDSRKFSSYYNIVKNYYGIIDSSSTKGVENFADKCQFINYDVYRACLESVNRQMWKNSTGILLWKSNSSWPSMVWQLYDWFLQAHAGYYAVRKAAATMYVQMNRDDKKVVVVNANYKSFNEIKIRAVLYNSDMKLIWDTLQTTILPENAATESLIKVPVTDKLSFLKLYVYDKSGQQLCDNFYWLNSSKDYTEIDKFMPPKIFAKAKKIQQNGNVKYDIMLTNNGNNLALMTALKLVGKDSGAEILPSYWNDNYVNLLPGETIHLSVEVNAKNITEDVKITLKSYNMDQCIDVDF